MYYYCSLLIAYTKHLVPEYRLFRSSSGLQWGNSEMKKFFFLYTTTTTPHSNLNVDEYNFRLAFLRNRTALLLVELYVAGSRRLPTSSMLRYFLALDVKPLQRMRRWYTSPGRARVMDLVLIRHGESEGNVARQL